MGISMIEFQKAMEIAGVKRLPDTFDPLMPNFRVPCFEIGDTFFIYTNSDFGSSHGGIMQRGKEVPNEIMFQAMAEVGEKDLDSEHFCNGRILSIKGILTLATMLQNRYSKDIMNRLMNQTYKVLLDEIVFRYPYPGLVYYCLPFDNNRTELCHMIMEFDKAVNPFFDQSLSFKEPSKYLDRVDISTAKGEGYFNIALKRKKSVEMCYSTDEHGRTYEGYFFTGTASNEYFKIVHYYHNGLLKNRREEGIYLVDRSKPSKEIDFHISLGIVQLTWKQCQENKARVATDQDIELMMKYLKLAIKKIRKNILYHMTEKVVAE